jgi:hypothetical protein
LATSIFVNHSAATFLLVPNGKFVWAFTHVVEVSELAQALKEELETWQESKI